jgi:hypothetical protein
MSIPPDPPNERRDEPTAPHSIDAGGGSSRSAVEPPAGPKGWRNLALVGGAVVVILLILVALF